MATERGQVKVDLQRFQNALDNNLDESVFNSASLKSFFASKSTTFRVTSNMFIPSFLVATSNAMGMAKASIMRIHFNVSTLLKYHFYLLPSYEVSINGIHW